jgi:hypothetical protein
MRSMLRRRKGRSRQISVRRDQRYAALIAASGQEKPDSHDQHDDERCKQPAWKPVPEDRVDPLRQLAHLVAFHRRNRWSSSPVSRFRNSLCRASDSGH